MPGGPVSKIAAELGINENTLHGWLKKYREKPDAPFPVAASSVQMMSG
ncbi:helix-turn-helix domain-containing protein|nr:helix-turn-helix domain-containing protein [Dendrosporobacter quercicolus DSM 1736]